jgi:hypothetical protein
MGKTTELFIKSSYLESKFNITESLLEQVTFIEVLEELKLNMTLGGKILQMTKDL